MWKIDDKKLTDKSEIWTNDDEWAFIEDNSLYYVKNVTRNKVLTVVSDGKVSLQAFSGQLKTRQLWSKGQADSQGYFHLQNAESMTLLTSSSPVNLEVKDRCNDELFGGISILLTGDFRQILPVVPGGTKGNELDASVKSNKQANNIATKLVRLEFYSEFNQQGILKFVFNVTPHK